MPTYKLNIPTPCHEKWNEMTATERGAFCHSCKKEVIDLSNKSNTQMAAIINAQKGADSMCARIAKPQMQFEFEYTPMLPSNSWFRRGLIGAALSLLVAAFAANGQTPPAKQKTETVAKKSTKKLVFTGKVLFEEGNVPADGINVTLAANGVYGAVTDSLGIFKLTIEKDQVVDSLFSFNNIGCQPLQVKLVPGVAQNIYLKKKVYQLDPLVISADRIDPWDGGGFVA
jgi:hypothetical protein